MFNISIDADKGFHTPGIESDSRVRHLRTPSPGQKDRGGKYRGDPRYRHQTSAMKRQSAKRLRIYEDTYTGDPIRKRKDPDTGNWVTVEEDGQS